MTTAEDAWADDRTSRVWIHGDLHAENFGTYMNSARPAGLRRQRLRRGLHRALLLGPAPVRGQPGPDRLAEGAARRDGPHPRREVPARLPRTGQPLRRDRPTTTTSHCTWRTPTGPVRDVLTAARTASRVALLDGMTRFDGRVRVFAEDADRPAAGHGGATQGRAGLRGATSRRSPSPRGTTASSSTTSATSSASPASASAAPASRRTTSWSRATASPSTTTWCSR